MGAADPEIARADKTAEVSSQFDGDLKKGEVVEGHFTAAELAKYGQTKRGLSPRHVQLMAIGGLSSLPELDSQAQGIQN